MISEKRTFTITAFGDTREVEFHTHYDQGSERPRIWHSDRRVALGKFPTGTKLHKTTITLYPKSETRETPTGPKTFTSRLPVATVIDGVEYVVSTTLYLHNKNNGQIAWWNDEEFVEKYGEQIIGKWN